MSLPVSLMGNGLFWNSIATLISCASFMPSGAVARLLWEGTCTFVINVASLITAIILVATATVLSVKIHRRSDGLRPGSNSSLIAPIIIWYSLYHIKSMSFAWFIPGRSMLYSCKPHGRPSMTSAGITSTWGHRPAPLWSYTSRPSGTGQALGK